MEITDYHAKLYAHELTRRCASDEVDRLAPVLADAQVDLQQQLFEHEEHVLEGRSEQDLPYEILLKDGIERVGFLDRGFRTNVQLEFKSALEGPAGQ